MMDTEVELSTKDMEFSFLLTFLSDYWKYISLILILNMSYIRYRFMQ